MPDNQQQSLDPELSAEEVEDYLRENDRAVSTGEGIEPIVIVGSPNKDPESKIVPLDPKPTWTDRPTLPDQVGNPDLVKMDKQYVEILDLSIPADIARYNDLLTKNFDPDTNVFILEEHKNFVEKTGNWKVFLKMQLVKFKVIIRNKHGKEAS